MAKRSLLYHWVRDGKEWVTEEQMAGTPDFRITPIPGGGYSLKWRSSRQATLHGTLGEAKDHANELGNASPSDVL